MKSKKHIDQSLMELNESFLGKLKDSLSFGGDGVFRNQERFYVSNVDDFRNRILYEVHGSF